MAFAPEASANCSSVASRIVRGVSLRAVPGSAGHGREFSLVRTALEDRDDELAPITGLWKLDVLQNGQVVDQAFETFTSDGNELMVDTTPPALDNVCNGIWVRTGERTYKIKHPSWQFDASGAVTGTAIIRTELTLARGGNSFRGTATIDIFDTAGNLLFELAGFDVRGTRITVD